ncbi:hypothetical protein BTO04_09325 [Polaribacter sp. SA4-10]|uniref:T9SS type A sorting domain-containing protein n=1 Tax=Polaribacter sp. SA4-10 TaxID=754397 RepID=UPI000B3CAD65|nr:T9SS type A sorting domain-containing protein [Polaribacter sp. SA4-10]ARV06870.1 hypothetical protein BTO04_09325 [Polaribacter sp. SA4-10]
MKKIYNLFNLLLISSLIISCNSTSEKQETKSLKTQKKSKKTIQEKADATRERLLYDFNMQKNPVTGVIPKKEKEKEFENALIEKQRNLAFKTATNVYVSRGPSNLGGRTRSLKVDLSDATGQTMLAGGVSSGVFRTTNGGDSWTKVSPFDEIHNVTTIAQDPRSGFQNIWYYGTGEYSGNSASIQESYLGYGVWKSTDSGLTWQQITETASGSFESFDNFFDFIIDIEVHPITGELFVGTAGKIYRLTVSGAVVELEMESNRIGWTDLEITSTGRVFATIDGSAAFDKGVWTSISGSGSWVKINPPLSDWDPSSRITLAVAPSNEDILYVLYNNGESNNSTNRVPEADLWQLDFSSNTWTNYSSKLPDEPGADSDGNDPFSIQGGYDLVISVKPDNSNFVVIGGTNVYKIADITQDAMFSRIGGYRGPGTYALYNEGGVNHHPDIHGLEWGTVDMNVLYTGTDGGVHKTNDINSTFTIWQNLNNNYLTYQYYHVNMVNEAGNDFIIGGAQDNGTTTGGINSGNLNNSSMSDYFGGDGAAVAVAKMIVGFSLDGYVVYASTQNGRILRGNKDQLTADIRPVESYDVADNPEYYPSQFVTYFHMDQDNPLTLYYASNHRILRTNNGETVDNDSWELVGGLPFSERVTTFETSRGTYNASSSYLLIGGRGGNVYRLDDPQNVTDLSSIKKITPSVVPTSTVDANEGQYTSDIAVHPTNPDIVMVTYASYGSDIKNIFITSNATSNTPTWKEVERNLSAHSVRAAAITVVNNKTIYFVGTARGLYQSDDPVTKDWSVEGGTIMGIPVISGLVYRSSDNILLVGTHGNGMFETNLNSSLSIDDNNISRISLAMYPNPVQLKLRFATNDFKINDTTKFSVYDIKGKEVINGKLKNKSIDVSSLSRGVYIVKLNHENIFISRKFVKN